MPSPITPEEQAAIDAWLERNKPKQIPRGESGIYDSFGRPRATLKHVYRALSVRIRKVRGHAEMTAAQIAATLRVPVADVTATCEKHQIGIADAGPGVQEPRRRRTSKGARGDAGGSPATRKGR